MRGKDGEDLPDDDERAMMADDSSRTVSVIMPVYNDSAYLRESLESYAGQGLAHTELIAVDDASTDDSREILEQLARQVQRIQTFVRLARTLDDNDKLALPLPRALLEASNEFIKAATQDRLKLFGKLPANHRLTGASERFPHVRQARLNPVA